MTFLVLVIFTLVKVSIDEVHIDMRGMRRFILFLKLLNTKKHKGNFIGITKGEAKKETSTSIGARQNGCRFHITE
jgi:hypothetical protein